MLDSTERSVHDTHCFVPYACEHQRLETEGLVTWPVCRYALERRGKTFTTNG